MMTVAPSSSGFNRHGFFTWPASSLARRAMLVAAGTLAWLAVVLALALLDVPDSGWGARLALGLSGLVAAVAAASSGVAAVVAIVRGERSVALALPLLLGALWTMLVLGELFPH